MGVSQVSVLGIYESKIQGTVSLIFYFRWYSPCQNFLLTFVYLSGISGVLIEVLPNARCMTKGLTGQRIRYATVTHDYFNGYYFYVCGPALFFPHLNSDLLLP